MFNSAKKAYRKWNVTMKDVKLSKSDLKLKKGKDFLEALCTINPMCGTVSTNSIQNALRLFMCVCELPQCCSAELGQFRLWTIDLSVMQKTKSSPVWFSGSKGTVFPICWIWLLSKSLTAVIRHDNLEKFPFLKFRMCI